jgi:hypothetical protein
MRHSHKEPSHRDEKPGDVKTALAQSTMLVQGAELIPGAELISAYWSQTDDSNGSCQAWMELN